jgi:hypothetical protein
MLSLNVYPGVLTAIARLAGCISASVGAEIRNMASTRSNLHQFLKGKQLYRALYEVYTEVLHDVTAVLKEGAAKGETAHTTITAPPSIEEFREQRRRKQKPTHDADKRATKHTTSTTGYTELLGFWTFCISRYSRE